MAPPPPQEKSQRPSFDPMEELETFLEKYTEPEKEKEILIEDEEEIEVLEEEPVTPVTTREVQNQYMQHLEDERFKEAVPQTFSDEKIYSDDVKDVVPNTGSDNIESSTVASAIKKSGTMLNMKKRKIVLKNFNARDAIIYSAIINRPYQ